MGLAPSEKENPSTGGAISGQLPVLPREVQIANATLLLEHEFLQLQASLSTCENACRVLASMERATRVLCSLTQGEERVRCEDARKRLKEARSRVRDACKECSNGVNTDPENPEP